jgi:DNA-binding YbaB/EbfC family protein
MFNKGQLAGLMKQATAMQENMKRAQEELANSEVVGTSGSGLVKITMTGKHNVKRIEIDPSLLVNDENMDKDMLEDMLTVAFNDAAKQLADNSDAKMGAVSKGMPGLPGGTKFPF